MHFITNSQMSRRNNDVLKPIVFQICAELPLHFYHQKIFKIGEMEKLLCKSA